MTNYKAFPVTACLVLTRNIKQILIAMVVAVMMSPSSIAQKPNMSQTEYLKEPRILTKDNLRMLVVEAKGDPGIIGGKAFSLLFQLYFSMQERPQVSMQAIPRARWPVSLDAPRSEWIGLYALPVPESITQLPQYEEQEGLKVSLTTWEYGEVAEIVHVGPYDREGPTIKQLIEFIKEQGFDIVDGHEEEYIKGPTMDGKGDPEKYVTILRYRVRKPARNN